VKLQALKPTIQLLKSKTKSNWPTTSRHERGYGSHWDKLRLIILKRDCGLCKCQVCAVSGRLLEATEVHHIKSKNECKRIGWSDLQIDDPSNLLSINKECHKRETAAEQGRILKKRVNIGEDGWPIAK